MKKNPTGAGQVKTNKRSKFGEIVHRLRQSTPAMIALCFILLLVLSAVFAPLIAPYDYAKQDLANRFQMPNGSHLLGTDEFGRDILSRLIYGGRISLLVSMMAVNNEVGSVLPVAQVSRLLRKEYPRVLLHCDAVQAWCKQPLRLGKALDVDFLSVSGHKIYAPKGCGALYVKKGSRLRPVSFGGGQEKNIRPGTEGIANLCAMGLSAQLLTAESAENHSRVTLIRDALLEGLTKLPDICINSPADATPCILNFSALGVRSEIMLHFLEEKGIYVSSGSACAKGGASHVLQAMGLERERADSAIRLSFGRYNTPEQVPLFLEALEEGLKRFRR